MWHSCEAPRSSWGFALVSDRKRNQPGKIKPPVNCHDYRCPLSDRTRTVPHQVVVRVRNGTLLVFPSYLQHSVDANAGSESRVSMSFNLMFPAFTAELSKPLWGNE